VGWKLDKGMVEVCEGIMLSENQCGMETKLMMLAR